MSSVTDDDACLAAELNTRGIEVTALPWDATADWAAFDAVVLRSCWDYHLRHEEFSRWIGRLERAGVNLWNPAAVVRWNLHKRYLLDADRAGVRIPPTRWINRGDATASLAAIMAMEGWGEVVVKPAISASATETFRAAAPILVATEERFRVLAAAHDLLVQEFLPDIGQAGEWSMLFFGGEFSHAVLKRPASGDFRVQEELGGRATAMVPPAALLEAAKRAMSIIPGDTLYVRVDGIASSAGFVLMELECIEPRVYLLEDAQAAARMTDALVARLRV